MTSKDTTKWTGSLKYVTNNGEGEGSEEINQAFGTIGDFTFGGAVAGALFKGSAIRSTNLRRRIAPIRPKFQRFLAGLFPGMVLGCVAGVCSLSFTFLQKYVEDMTQQQEILEEESEEILSSGSDHKNDDE